MKFRRIIAVREYSSRRTAGRRGGALVLATSDKGIVQPLSQLVSYLTVLVIVS